MRIEHENHEDEPDYCHDCATWVELAVHANLADGAEGHGGIVMPQRNHTQERIGLSRQKAPARHGQLGLEPSRHQ